MQKKAHLPFWVFILLNWELVFYMLISEGMGSPRVQNRGSCCSIFKLCFDYTTKLLSPPFSQGYWRKFTVPLFRMARGSSPFWEGMRLPRLFSSQLCNTDDETLLKSNWGLTENPDNTPTIKWLVTTMSTHCCLKHSCTRHRLVKKRPSWKKK